MNVSVQCNQKYPARITDEVYLIQGKSVVRTTGTVRTGLTGSKGVGIVRVEIFEIENEWWYAW